MSCDQPHKIERRTVTGWNGPPGPGLGAPTTPGPVGGRPFGRPPAKQRETGAQLACVLLLVAAILGCIIAGFAAGNNDGTAAAPAPATYAPGGVAGGNGAQGGAAGTSPAGGSDTSGNAAIRNFPQYPGARRLYKPQPIAHPGTYFPGDAKVYLSNASLETVNRWYRQHLPQDHLKVTSRAIKDLQTGKNFEYFLQVNTPTTVAPGNFVTGSVTIASTAGNEVRGTLIGVALYD